MIYKIETIKDMSRYVKPMKEHSSMQISTHEKYLHFCFDFWLSSEYFAKDFAITVYSFNWKEGRVSFFFSFNYVKTD